MFQQFFCRWPLVLIFLETSFNKVVCEFVEALRIGDAHVDNICFRGVVLVVIEWSLSF